MFTNSKPGGGYLDNPKKGFTLIELLAVIVILAIIALITIPIVMNMIKTAKKSSARSSALGYIDAVNYNNDLASMNNDYGLDYSLISDGTHQVNSITVKMKGKKPTSGTITIENKKVTEATLCIEGYSVVYDVEKKDASVEGTCDSSETQTIYKETKLNGADPELKSDMIPVTIENDGTVKRADIYTSWYSYNNKKWANAVVLTDNTSYEAGDTIPEAKIKAYYVWIPRYKYQIFNDGTTKVDEQTINIIFENKTTSKSNSTTKGGYLTHPAFTYGSEELNGIWVGKFETTGTASSPTIKPNIQSLRSQKVADQYTSSQNISTGSIMMKNDEWGAMAYLSHSKYGTNKQIRINNKSGYKTGCGANEDNAEASSTCEIAYGSNVSSYPQSTTGNIYGIFDTSGGAWEYVMGVKADQTGKPYSGRHNVYNSGFNGTLGCPTCDNTVSGVDSSITELTSGTDFPDSKNYNLYNGTNYNNACNSSKCYGDATRETQSWYSDYYSFVSASYPWVIRGGVYADRAGAGVFSVSVNYGSASSNFSFRSVVR